MTHIWSVRFAESGTHGLRSVQRRPRYPTMVCLLGIVACRKIDAAATSSKRRPLTHGAGALVRAGRVRAHAVHTRRGYGSTLVHIVLTRATTEG